MESENEKSPTQRAASPLTALVAEPKQPAKRTRRTGTQAAKKEQTPTAGPAEKGAAPAAKRARTRKPAPTPKPAATVEAPADEVPSEVKVGVPLARTAGTGKPIRSPDIPVTSSELYLNREMTWLNFNQRVFQNARDERQPLLERVKFLAITSNNLDEFFMKRMGGLKQQVGANMHNLSLDGRTPQQQIDECHQITRRLHEEMCRAYLDLVDTLAEEDIRILSFEDLKEDEKEELRSFYYDNIYPLVTPQAMDPAHPFPFISNLSLNLLVTLRHPGEVADSLARVKVPVGKGITRFLKVGELNRFVPLEEVMANNLDLLFPDMDFVSCEFFRVTRNANTEKDEERAEDLLSMIETELRDRKLAPIVRMECMTGMDPVHRGMLAAELGLDEDEDVYETETLLAMRDLFEIAFRDIPALHDADHHPADNHALQDDRNIFHIIRQNGPILLHHPYESFTTSVERFVREAANDPKVLAIKMTLYRTSAGTRIIDYLVDAAQNGKQVAVVVELKARFDEEANINWASRLEEVGINVTYGVVGLKTHSKVILVIRKDFNGLRRYAHIGTGNYHAGTARIYADLGLLTCVPEFGQGLTELFNYLTTGYKPKRDYRKILPAPKVLKNALLDRIEREIALAQQGEIGLIRFKANALEDKDVTEYLYRASQAGVTVQLIIRDTCRIRPGLPGISDNVTVVSIVGRFLEHTRIFHFGNAGDDEYLIGSADLMTRNLESRVEVVIPVEPPELQAELDNIITSQIEDNVGAWDMQPDGGYVQRQPAEGEAVMSSQQRFIDLADRRQFEATRLRKRKPKGIARRRGR